MSLNERWEVWREREMPNYLTPESENCLKQQMFSWYPTILTSYFNETWNKIVRLISLFLHLQLLNHNQCTNGWLLLPDLDLEIKCLSLPEWWELTACLVRSESRNFEESAPSCFPLDLMIYKTQKEPKSHTFRQKTIETELYFCSCFTSASYSFLGSRPSTWTCQVVRILTS